MDKVRISDDERLVTLTEVAYNKLQEEIKELKAFKESKSLRIISNIEFYPVQRIDVTYYGLQHHSIDSWGIKRNHEITAPYEYPGEYEPNAVLLDRINRMLNDARNIHDGVYREITDKLKELNETIKTSREAIHKNSVQIEEMYASVPKIVKFIFNIKQYGKTTKKEIRNG